MSSGRKSIGAIIFEGAHQNNPDGCDFCGRGANAHDMMLSCALAGSWYTSAAPELAALWRPAGTGRARPLVLVAEDQPALLQIVGRHLDSDPVAGERFDAILL